MRSLHGCEVVLTVYLVGWFVCIVWSLEELPGSYVGCGIVGI